MARGFGSTLGAGATDRVLVGSTLTLGITLSAAWWQWENGTGGGGFGVPFSIGDNGFNHLWMGAYTSSTLLHFERDWTTAFTDWTITKPSTGVWHHLAIVYDGSSSANKPLIYIDGASQTVTAATAPSGALSTITQAPCIGNSQQSSFGFNWDGMIAETGFWNSTLLTGDEVTALAKGAPPRCVRPSALTLYAPLYGVSGEPDFGLNHYALTLTGTARQNHPPVQEFYI